MSFYKKETYYPNGQLESRIYYLSKTTDDEILHRLNGPATEHFYENGLLRSYMWCDRGKRHRAGAPAYEMFTEDNILMCRIMVF